MQWNEREVKDLDAVRLATLRDIARTSALASRPLELRVVRVLVAETFVRDGVTLDLLCGMGEL